MKKENKCSNTMLVDGHYSWFQLQMLPLERLMDVMPQNLVVYRDSGVWSIRDEQFNEVYEDPICYTGDLKDLVVNYILSLPLTEDRACDIAWALAGN